jgi:hypothetical protein
MLDKKHSKKLKTFFCHQSFPNFLKKIAIGKPFSIDVIKWPINEMLFDSLTTMPKNFEF